MIYEKLLNIQTELKAPKGQKNTFGNYYYRSCEDILEAVKPLTQKYKCVLFLSDMLEQVGERYYIKVTATLVDIEDKGEIKVTAEAREEENKKGMDASQITGSTSSYARKYALNGLFDIDDTKDADTNEFGKTMKNGASKKPQTYSPQNKVTYTCSSCGQPITKAEFDYSNNKFKKALCRGCQKNA